MKPFKILKIGLFLLFLDIIYLILQIIYLTIEERRGWYLKSGWILLIISSVIMFYGCYKGITQPATPEQKAKMKQTRGDVKVAFNNWVAEMKSKEGQKNMKKIAKVVGKVNKLKDK